MEREGVPDGRDVATTADLWPLVYAVPTEDLQSRARDALRELLEMVTSENADRVAARLYNAAPGGM